MSRPNRLADFFSVLAGAGVALGTLGGIVVLGYQAYFWLKNSVWLPYGAVTPLRMMDMSWARNPTDWYGLHRLLDATPLSIAVFLSGLAVSATAVALAHAVSTDEG